MSLNEQFAFLSPVQFVKVSPQNLQEVAEWCGGKVAKIESRRQKGKMEDYVWVPTPEGTKTSSAFPGMYVTKRIVMTTHGELKVTWAVFAGRYFEKNYFDTPLAAVDATWAKTYPKMEKPEAVKPVETGPKIVQHIYVQPGENPGAVIQAASDNIPSDASL